MVFVIHWHESAMDLHVPHPDPPSRLPLHPIPLGLPSVPALSTRLMHPTWSCPYQCSSLSIFSSSVTLEGKRVFCLMQSQWTTYSYDLYRRVLLILNYINILVIIWHHWLILICGHLQTLIIFHAVTPMPHFSSHWIKILSSYIKNFHESKKWCRASLMFQWLRI